VGDYEEWGEEDMKNTALLRRPVFPVL
jgi:hypothetical protein